MPSAVHHGIDSASSLIESIVVPITTNVLTVGDSLTYGQDATASAWPIAFANMTGMNAVNPARPGWTSVDMAIKVGAIDPTLTFPNNTIPASGAVTLDAISPSTGFRMATGIDQNYTGVVNGVAGTLVHTANTTTWTFTRTTAGSSIAVGGPVPFHCTENDAYAGYDLIIMLGRNDMNYSGYMQTIINSINAIIAHSSGNHYLVVGTLSLVSSSDLTNVQAVNTTLYNTYGDGHFFDPQSYLASNAAFTAVGISPTSTDSSQMASGYIPDSLSTTTDRPHLNANGYTSLGKAIADKVATVGWLSSGSTGGTQPTGAGISRYQDLAGSTFDARWDAAGSNSMSLAPGTFSFNDFAADSTNYGADTATSKGILGSGVAYTTIQMALNTSTVTAQDGIASGTTGRLDTNGPDSSGGVNTLYLLRSNYASSPTFDGFTLNGTAQGATYAHLYNGMRVDGVSSPTFSNMKVVNVPGDNPSPPGETFYINVYNSTNPTFDTVEFDGNWNSASTGATNGSTKDTTGAVNGTLTYRRVYGHEIKYGKIFAGWQTFGGGTFTECFCVNTAFGYGFEECGGTWTFNDCTFGGNIADLHLGNSHAARSTIIINDPILLAGQTKIKAYIPVSYGGNGGGLGNAQSASDIKIFVGGVDKTSTMLQVITTWIWNSDGSYKGTPITYTPPSWLPW